MDKPGLRDALPQPKLSDTRTDPFWSNLDSSLSAAAAPSAAQTPQRDLNVGLGDVARGVGAGALDLVGGIGELARQASQFGKENAGKQGGDYLEQARANMASKLSPVLDVVAGAGDLAKSGAESLTDGMSGDAKEAIGRSLIDETPEGRLTMGDGAGDLDVWAMKMAQGVGSMVPTLLAGGVTGAAAKASIGRAVTTSMLKRGATQEVAEAVAAKTVAKLATGAAATTGATGSVGSAGVNTRESVLGMSFDELSRSDTFRQAFTRIDQDQQTAHLSDEEKLGLAREETANLASRATMSDAKVWGAAAMGSMMGDAMLFKMLAGKAATGGVLKGAAKGAAGEGISETLEEGVQQYAVNESLNEVAAADIDPMKGVMSSAIEGGLIGMGAGGAVGAVGGARGSKHASPEEDVGTDPVSEPSATVTEEAAGPAGDPVSAFGPQEGGEQAPSATQAEGDLNPLGPSGSQFDELRDVPAYLRQDDTADRYKGMAADSEVQRALAGEFGQTVQDLVATQMQAGDQGKSLYERAQAGELGVDPFAGNKSAQQVAMENQRLALPLKDVIFAGDANAKPKGEALAAPGDHDDHQAGPGPQFRGTERTRWQSGQEGDLLPPERDPRYYAAEALPGATIEGEGREAGTELPHRNVVYGTDGRPAQQQAANLAQRERELANQPPQIGQSDTIFAGGASGSDPRNSAYTPPKLSRDQVDGSLDTQSTRDPRSEVARSIEVAGKDTDSVFGPLQTLRITRKGKPFATEKEAAMASRKGQEMPVPLNGGGFGVAAIGEVQQAQAQQGGVKQPSSNSAQQDRQDGKTEIAQNGMVIVHGSGNPGMSEQDIQIVRASGQKQGKKGRVYGGFYGTSEQDAHQAQAYADMMGGTPTLYDVKIKPGTKVLHKQGDITRLSESYINELVSQGYGVVTGTDPRGQTEHVVIDKSAVASMAPRGAQATPSQVNDTNVADIRQPSDQPAKNVSADTVPAPSATAGEASQLVPAIDTGYREVIPGNQPQVEVSNEPVTPIPAISSERSGDQPGAGEPAAAGAGPAVAGLTDRAGSGDRADLAAPAPVPDGQQQDDPTLTAPATDAGAAVSGRIGEEELRDRDLLKEHGGHWKYRSAVGAGWFTANTKEAAIERAEEAYRKAVSKGEPVPTRDERFAQADAELFSEMDRRYGKMSTPELEAEYQRFGGEVGDLQKSGSGEFNGNGGRRTGAAVSNEGARQVGEERLRLGVYMKMRRDRDTAGSGAKSQQIEPANDWRGAKSATDYHAAKRRLFSGEMEFSEFQAMSRSALDNAPSLRAELEKKTKQDLLDQMSRFNAARYKNDKKAVVVEAAYNQLIGDLRWAANGDGNTISETYAIGGARQSIEERVAKALDGLTPERYQQFVNKQRADVAKRDAELAATKEALRDPQTLEQFKTFLKYRSLDKLTPEQRARYEDLIAASNLDKRDQANEVKAATAVTPTASGDIIKTKHTKSGEDLFVVQMGDRVDRDTYNQINAHAKKLGGWYSSYKVGGAVPGFQFKDEAKATEFRGWLTGQGAASAAPSAEAAPTEVTEPAQTDSKSKQVETLRTRAKTLRDKATAALNAERKENTNKRMTEAANARANAESELHFAGLLDAIADGIESGEVTYLRNLANGTQLTELNHALSRSLWNLPPARREALTSQGMIERAEDGRERWSAKATPEMMAEGAQMPGMDYFARNLKDVATKMQGASGFKQAGAKIMALVNAAINRDSKTVSITDPELIAKLKAYTSGVSDYDAKAVKEQINGYSRLERMGITNHTELRAALRELARLQAVLKKQAVPRDPLAEKMVALKRKLVGNRNAFIDFFPTPESHAADLVALAGIEPGMTVLEPSAGHGMLAEAARAAGAKVDAVELAVDLREILQAKGFGLVGGDFMDTTPAQSYDAVVMNPPFSGDMDVDHVRHAYDHLKPGGRLVAIVSATAGDRQNNKNKAFREWFDGLGGSEQAMPEGSFKASLNPTDVRTKIFVIDKPANEAKPLPSPEGKRVTVATPKGQSVEVQYRVMEAADLVASHDFEGNLNHDYPQQLQPRDRSKQTYRVQVGQIAAAPDGARLAASPETDRGAPIVRDGIVESGNGRSIGLRQAYQRGDADAYRRYIEANAADFGIDPAVIGAMKQPVLVRERITTMTDDQLRDFVVDSNTDAKMANSAAEDAGADAGKLTDDMLDLLNIPEGGDVLASQNNRFLQAFLSAIGENQSNSYVSRDGQWNDAYRKRVTAAIFAYGYDNQRLLDAATGEVDADGRNITTALINNAVGMAKLRQHSPERAKVISNYLAEAVESIARTKRSGQSLQEMAAQSDMLGGDTSPEGSLLAQAIAASASSAKAITGMVGDILTMLNKTTSADMFGAAMDPATPETAINETLKAISAYNQQKASQPKPGGDLFGLAGARNNHGAAPSVPRSGDASAAKGAGGVTEGRLELDGVSIRIPAIDEEQQRLYNQATHRGQGVNFASGISTGVGRILNDLKDAGLLDTAEQRAAAEAEVQAWANEEAINARKLMRDGIKTPSWVITGRSGRKAQSSAATERENNRQTQHYKDQDARIKALRDELKKLRPKEVIGRESFNYAWGKAKGMIAEYASALSGGQPNLLASLRKSMNSELSRYLQAMEKIDAQGFIKTLSEQDNRLKAAGYDGLVAIVGARSNPGKIISDAINGRIRFSKQAMAQGEKPAKHLTRKEAELVTKEWFKQYRGASGIDVQIHATQAELEKALGLAAQDGLIRRAAFDDDSGTLHVAADTIANPKRMREILRHEVLAHYGLANVLGDGEYTKLMSRLIQSQKDPSMKPVWDWVNTHYADEDIGTQAEEVVAHLAELEQGAWGRGWDRVVAWVTRALRAVGFVPDGITAAETRSLIEGLGKKLQRSGPDDSGPDGGKKFSQEAELPANDGGIKMSQSVADNSPSLEQSITQKAKYQAGAALGSVKNYIKQKRPVMLGTLTDLQIDQVYRDITGGAVSQYQRLRTQMEADRNDILLDAETRIDPLWDALDKQVKTALSNLMHDATMTRLHPDKSLDENSYYLEAKQKVERAKKPETKAAYEAELHIIERNHSELARQYNALPANAKALYDTMQDTYTKQWESLRGAIEQRLEDLLGVNQGRAMAAEMRQKMEHALQHGPYFPLTRYGDYVVKARKGDEYVREHIERRVDAEQAVKQYQRDGYNAVMTVKEEGGGDSANANQLGMEMLSFLDSTDGVSKSALKDEIWQAMLRMMPDASYAKHAIHRRRVKGASRDAHRAYLNSVYHYARHVSKIRYGHKMQGELDKLSEQIRAGVAGEPSSLKPEDLEIAQQVLNEMNKRHDLNMNPTGKAWAGAAGNIGFLYYIGPSVASAVVNMTQNFTVMLPQLGAKYGFAKSAAAMTQALGDYVKHGKFKAGTTEAWHSLTRSTTLPADERAILDRLYRAGALDLTQAHSIAAKADTDQQDAKPMGKRWRRAMRWAGATFHNAEVLNREVAALAAYRLLKQAEPTLNGQQYADRVAEMVYDGHGNYAASNRPRYMRNDITKVLTQFKIYSQMMTYVLYSNAIKAAKGDKVAQKTLAGVLATHWVMAGVMGLPTPITAVVYAIAAGLDDDDDHSGEASFRLALTEALGPRAGELLAKGPMDALTNLSIAGRTGLGDLWWRSPKEGTEGDDLAWHAVQQLLGPVAGIGINLARGAGQMTDGHIQRGLETMLPKSIRDVAKSYRQATEGEQTIKGDIIMDDVSTWNVAMQGLGFGSAQMAKNYDAREYIKGKEKRIADKRSQLLTDYYMARKSGEMDEVQEVLERIKMFNSIHHPRERITGKSLALSFKSKLRSNERTQGGVYLNRNREYLREEGRFAD